MLSLFYILLALLPVLIYITLIWLTLPINSINFRKSIVYAITGIIGVGVVLTLHDLFPFIIQQTNNFLSYFIFSFLQIALVEELSKLSAFFIGEKIIKTKSEEDELPISIMFYCGISALGFSFLENVHYAIMYGGEVLIIRSTLSMILHFLCGLIMGYWVAKSRLPVKIKNRSLLELKFIKNPKLKSITMISMGVFCASAIHGLFDFNILTNGHITSNYLIIASAIIASYLGAKELISIKNKKKKCL